MFWVSISYALPSAYGVHMYMYSVCFPYTDIHCGSIFSNFNIKFPMLLFSNDPAVFDT